MAVLLKLFGLAFLALGAAAGVVARWGTLKRSATADAGQYQRSAMPTQPNANVGMFDAVEAVKAFRPSRSGLPSPWSEPNDHPGADVDGYRIAFGGLSQTPVAAPASWA